MKIIIPEKLKQPTIKFVLLEKSGKKPFQKEWQNKVINFDNPELIGHLFINGNYGVMGGGEKNLIIIDFDNEKVQNEVCKKLPPTFTVKTGSGKLHKYFFSDKSESFKIFDRNMDTLADVQGEGKQVVGPGSIHPNGNIYEVIEDNDISFLSYAEIKALLIPYDKKAIKEKREYEKPKGISTDDFLDVLKTSISMEEVLNSFGVDTSKNPTECPFHNSRGGKCLGFNYETAHCFHCDGSWNIFSLVKEMKKCDFREALQYLANIAGLNDELEKSKRRYLESLKESEQSQKKLLRSEFINLIAGKEKKWGLATELLVEYVKEKAFIYTTKDDNKSEMWIYRDGIYIPQGKSEVKIILRDLLDSWYSQYIFGLVIAKLEPDTSIDSDKFFANSYREEVPVINGILNVLSGEIKPFTPEKVFFNKLPVEYNPQADCPLIEKFLEEVLSSEEDKNVFYELGGFCLLNDYNFEKAFMFVGNGRNGKDKTLELLKRMLGVENCTSLPLSALIPDSFIISELFNKKANLAGEINNQDLKDTAAFKALTGRSLMSAKRKFLNNISFVNNAKLIFACNDLPMVYDTSRGFWDRWILLEFPYTFVIKEEYDSAKDKGSLRIRDENIIEKITTAEEMSGLLNKFLQGLTRLTFSKNFSVTRGTEEIKNLWIKKSNSFIAFCMDNVEANYDKKINKKDLRRRYTEYCKKHKVLVKSDVVIKRVLQDEFGANEGQDSSDYGLRFWEGIKWKEEL
jgi:P4 family phage/plasmid primase-like protien